jgi:hypothetical protein
MLKDGFKNEFTGPFSEMLNRDCMDLERGLQSIPDKFYDIALCDIPYGINVGNMAYLRETKNTVLQKNGKRLNANRNKKVYTLKDWDLTPPPKNILMNSSALVRVKLSLESNMLTGKELDPGGLSGIRVSLRD